MSKSLFDAVEAALALPETDLETLTKKLNAYLLETRQVASTRRALEFKIGDKVKFLGRSSRLLRGSVGVVTKMNQKTFGVVFDGKDWRVPFDLLERVL